jgi:NDP-sugar pyrophosphorylase family protein
MKAMILAAGLGTRLRPLTHHTPKPLFKLGGYPLLHILISKLQAFGCEAVIINTHHLAPMVDAFVKAQKYTIPVFTRHEETLLETGGGIKNVADFWDDRPFLVINGDIFSDIDLKEIYDYHGAHEHPATLVLHDYEAFNNVWVTSRHRIIGFGTKTPCPPHKTPALRDNDRPLHRQQLGSEQAPGCLAFTGIHVLDPLVLDFISANQAFSIIDAYCNMIASDLVLQGYEVTHHFWHDIGSMSGYRRAAREALAQKAFGGPFMDRKKHPLKWSRLQGDGSDRIWHRVQSETGSIVLVDHGPPSGSAPCEADAFYHIGTHLKKKGVPVARIHGYDPALGLIATEDLGDVHLQFLIGNDQSPKEMVDVYQPVLDLLIEMGVKGAQGFDASWTFQTAHYDEPLVMEKECAYFVEAFLTGYLGMNVSFSDLEADFSHLAETATRSKYAGFLHRDFQSRNILVRKNNGGADYFFIDYQAGRLGPLQYDLASLLIDPYVNLPGAVRDTLYRYYVEQLSKRLRVNASSFLKGFQYCSVTRNLQALGAFGFLSRVKGKTTFETYIPAAIQTLKKNIRHIDLPEKSPLRRIIKKL